MNIISKSKVCEKTSGINKAQSGFTMLEILVALALGVAILTAAISMQIQHRKGFKLSNNKLQMQTNAKFAIEFISQSLRSAGNMGCRNGKELTKGELRKATDECNYGVCIAFNNPQVAYADFRTGYEILGYEYAGGLVPTPPIAFTFVANTEYNADSDIITVAGGYGEVYPLASDDEIQPVDDRFQLDMSNIQQIRLKQSQYGLLSSCQGAYFFKVTSSDAGIAAGVIQWGGGGAGDDNATGQADKFANLVGTGIRGNREFRRAAVTSYFVGMDPLNDPQGVPYLYQDVDGESKRLVKGVEEIQILYGLSDNPTRRNIADRYLTADVIAAGSSPTNNLWARVVSVRIGLIMRSEEQVYATDQTQTKTLECVNYTQTVKTDRFSRSTYCAEVSIRNRLTGARVGEKI